MSQAPENASLDAKTNLDAALTFDKALAELETIVAKLERGDVPLEQSITIYERGEALKTHCEALLKAAEMKVEKIRLNGKGQVDGVSPLDAEG